MLNEIIDSGRLNRDTERDRLHFTKSYASVPAKLEFYDSVASRVYAAEMHACSTVRMVRAKCTSLEITIIVWTARKPSDTHDGDDDVGNA